MAGRGDINKFKVQPIFSKLWLSIPLESAFRVIRGYEQVKTRDSLEVGAYPIVDQGDKLVSGYTNSVDAVYRGELPVIIFGDHTRKIKYIDFDFVAGADGTKVLRPISLLDPKFFYYYMLSLDVPNLGYSRHYSILKRLDFPVLTLPEQERIANKLDILFAQIDNVRRATDRIPQLLKNLRQQILTHAVTGKLTAEWRNGSDTSSWEMKQLKDIAIPKSGYAFKSSEFTDSGIQVIRMGNLYGNKLSLERSPVFVDTSYDSNIVNKYKLNNNDILLTLTGTKYKRDYGYAIKINTDTPLLLNQRILSLTPQIDADFLMYLLREESFRDCFFSFETGGVNQGNVGVQNVMKISMLIPPQKEQEAIVEKVTALFEQLDNIEERYERLTQKLKDLPQSLLHKAFKGELVPQLSTDGSAADLLREIETLNKTITKRKK